MKEEITLQFDHGTAKKGEVFIRGDLLHGVPKYYAEKDEQDATKWYWAKNSAKEDNRFLHINSINITSEKE